MALLSYSLPLLVILKQTVFKFINKAMNHSSPIINCLANVSIRNPLPICNASHRQLLNGCDNMHAISANDIDHAGNLVCRIEPWLM